MKQKAENPQKFLEKLKGIWKSESSKRIKSKTDLALTNQKSIIKAVQESAAQTKGVSKLSKSMETVGVISVLPPQYYPLVESKAALLSQITSLSTIPLLLDCKKPKELSSMLQPLTPSFSHLFVIGLRDDYLNELKKSAPTYDYITDVECEATAITTSVLCYAKAVKANAKKLNILFVGTDRVLLHTAQIFGQLGIKHLFSADERGSLYARRPNMNKDKIALLHAMPEPPKQTLEECCAKADVVITSNELFPQAEQFKRMKKNSLVVNLSGKKRSFDSSLLMLDSIPGDAPYITDYLISGVLLLSRMQTKAQPQRADYAKIAEHFTKHFSPTKKKLIPFVLDTKELIKLAKKL